MGMIKDYLGTRVLTVIPPKGTLIQVLSTGSLYIEPRHLPASGDFPNNDEDIKAFKATIRNAGFVPFSSSTDPLYRGLSMDCQVRCVAWKHPDVPDWRIRIKEEKWTKRTTPAEA